MGFLTNLNLLMTIKTALITGITGQDGSLLAHYLLNRNYKVIAPTRENPDISRLSILEIGTHNNLELLIYENWNDFKSIINKYQPDQIYHFAAMSHVGESHKNPDNVFDVNTMWTLKILQAIENFSPSSRLFFASSCEIFASHLENPVDENSPKQPTNPYGISKLAAHQLVKYYREVKGLYCSNGILFNHESALRDESFVSKKIVQNVARIVKNGGKPLSLGNINAKKDWGYAPDFIKIIAEILQLKEANDYIIATGKLHSVKDMVNAAFSSLNYPIYWQGKDLDNKAINKQGEVVVTIDKRYYRPLDNRFLVGNTSHLTKKIKIESLTPFEQWVKYMTIKEYEQLT